MNIIFLRWLTLVIALQYILSGCIAHPTAPVTDLSPLDKTKSTYTVKKNDTLYAIAFRVGIDHKKLAAWNNLADPSRIYIGEVLDLKPGQVNNSPQEPSKPRVNGANSKLASAPVPEVKLPLKVSKWRWPAEGKLSQSYSKSKARFGIQITAKRNSPIIATAPGQVVYAGNAIKGYGELVIVKHSSEFISAYAHNDQIMVKEGESVKAGQTLAQMGSTGTDRVKLHFEIRKDGDPVNPLKYLPLKRG